MAGPILKRSSSERYRPLAEINVTPLVDVMLLLMIVFMVTAPLMNVGVPVDLPKTESAILNDDVEPLVVTVNDKEEIYLQEMKVDPEELILKLNAITENKKEETKIFVRGDKGLLYGKVMEVMGMLSSAGYKKVTLVAEMPGGGAKQTVKSVSKMDAPKSNLGKVATSKGAIIKGKAS